MSETEKLIELVKGRRFLYDTNDHYYKNRPRRLEGWQEIANEMGGGTAALWSTKWKSLKDNYVKFKKTSDNSDSAITYKKYKNWPWAEHLRFLDDCNFVINRKLYTIQVNNTNTNSEHTQDPKYCNVLFMPDPNLTTQVEDMHDPVPEGLDNYASENKRRKIKYEAELPEEFEYQMKRNEEKPALDGVDHFFLSYAQSFKQLPTRMQIMLKLEIATLFSRYELQAEGVTSESIDSIPRMVHPVKCEFECTNTIDD